MSNAELSAKFLEINSNLQSMDLPFNRKDASRGQNLQWLLRNIHVRNSSHPRFATTIALLAKVGRESHQLRACDVPMTQGADNGNGVHRSGHSAGTC